MNKRILALVLILVITLSLALSGCKNSEVTELSEYDKAEALDEFYGWIVTPEDYSDFAVKLLEECFEGEDNTLISPLSVALAFGMVAEGADGETLKEIETALDADIEDLRGFSEYIIRKTLSNNQLSAANSLWINNVDDFTVNEDFLERNREHYCSDIYEAKFNNKTVNAINEWVKDKTDGMIDKIIDNLDERSVMCLVNALLFDAKWREPYEESQVDKGIFVTEDNVSQNAQYLYSSEGHYLEDEKATGFLKYYEELDYAFVAMLPNEGVSVKDYVKFLDGDKINALLENVQGTTVYTKLPKFESDFSASLKEILINMGMEKAFDENEADFSGLGTVADGNIYIGNVVHKTKISVTEQGTKAGAATAVIMYGAGAPLEPKEVYLDRPFVYMIVDMENNIPVFIGTLMSVE